ncbi:HET domain containing protein [Pyrenophora tritici-repentis]|nr:HET domain containing protein [Pyrenophora tritici-repentis]
MYSQLNVLRREIRLLHLHLGLWDDGINAYLETVSFDDYPNYKALSYVWGDASQILSITVDGEAPSLTLSLYTALRRLRTPESKLVLWADAVCINQSDPDERSQQVRFMGEIYSRAEEVVICLGYSGQWGALKEQLQTYQWTENNTDMELVNAYFEESHSTETEEDEEDEDTEDVLGLFVYLKLRSIGKHLHEILFFSVDKGKLNARNNWQSTLRAMSTLASNPWWTRTWVVQETVLARKATVAYHNMTAPWSMLANASSESIVHHSSCCQDLLNTRHPREERILTNLQRLVYDDVELLRSTRAQGRSLSLKQLMSLTALRDATDVRDKVYGLLGLVTDWRGIPALIPDYNLPPKEVFAQAIFHHIQRTLSLQILMGTTPSGIPDLPSWVTARGRSRHLNLAEGARATRSSLFSAAGSTVANVARTGKILRADSFEPIHRVS